MNKKNTLKLRRNCFDQQRNKSISKFDSILRFQNRTCQTTHVWLITHTMTLWYAVKVALSWWMFLVVISVRNNDSSVPNFNSPTEYSWAASLAARAPSTTESQPNIITCSCCSCVSSTRLPCIAHEYHIDMLSCFTGTVGPIYIRPYCMRLRIVEAQLSCCSPTNQFL